MTPSVQADLLALDAANAGEHLWRATELTPGGRKVLSFECAVQSISEEIVCEYARKLFHDTAMQAIPIVLISADKRKAISNAAMDAWQGYVNFLRDEQAEEAADYRRDMARAG